MNCRPGDLAIVVGVDTRRHLLGLIVRVTAVEILFGLPHWHTDPPYRDKTDGGLFLFADEDLRPIRPGDISEEEVRDLFSPVKEEA